MLQLSRVQLIGFGLLVLSFSSTEVNQARAAISDLAADYSETTNPNGVWSYGYLSANGSFNQDADNRAFLENGTLPTGSPGFVAYDTFNGGGVGGGGGWTGGLGFPFAGHLGVPSEVISYEDGLTDWPSSTGDNASYPNGILGGHSPNSPFTTGWYGVRYTASSSGPVDVEMKSWQTTFYPDVPPNPTFGGATRSQQIRIDKVVGSTRTSLSVSPNVTRHGVTNITGTPQYTAANAQTPGDPGTFATEQDEINAALRSSAKPNLNRLTNINLNSGESIVISYAPQQGLNFAGFHGFNVVVRSGADRIGTTRWDLSDDWSVTGTSATGIGPDAAWSYGTLSNGSFAAYDRIESGFEPDDENTPGRENHGWGTPEQGWFDSGITDPETGPIVPGMVKDADGFNMTTNTDSGQFIDTDGDWSGGKVALHTPSAEVDADRTSVLRWTAPRNMSVNIDGGMWRLTLPDETDRRHQYELLKGASVLASGTIDELGFGPTDTNSTNPESFSISSLAVTTGEILELRISPLSSGGGSVTADFDGSGTVDGGDLTQWQTAYGVDDSADADGDGDSDGADFLAWQREFGLMGGASSEPSFVGVDFTVEEAGILSAAVPEPISAIQLLFAVAALALGRRRS